jgi:hypothetical protein
MQNKIVYLLLGVIIVMLINDMFQSCSRDQKSEAEYKKQIERTEKLSKDIEVIAARRVDSIHTLEKKLTERIIEKEKVQHEIYNITDIDSVVKRYYYWRPDEADSTDR